MAISRDTIEKIKSAIEIVEVISDYVNLKRKGANYMGLSPFKDEKTPSFSVSPSKQLFKDFSSGESGDAIKFVQLINGVDYPEALRMLAAKYNIEIEEEHLGPKAQQDRNERESLLIIYEFAANFFADQLKKPDYAHALKYFNDRGFSSQTIGTFKLGYAPDSYEAFTKAAIKAGFSNEILKLSALVRERENGTFYDSFRGRVIFPITNVAGKIIAFAGRTLTNEQPKYLNSPETPLYIKSQQLYGLSFARDEIRRNDRCILTEGYTDTITLYQSGIKNVVSSSGTSLTDEQIKLIKRFSHKITVLYDGDNAGIAASMRGIDKLLENDLDVKAVRLPQGTDPDEYCRQLGGEAFAKYINDNQTDFIAFKAKVLLSESENDVYKQAELANSILESISKIPDPIKRQLFQRQAAQILGIDEATLINQTNQLIKRGEAERNKPKINRVGPTNLPDPLPPPIFDDFIDIGSDVSIDFVEDTKVVISPEKSNQMYRFDTARINLEKNIIRLLLLYGNTEFADGGYFYQYLIAEVEDVEWLSGIFKQIYNEYIELANSGTIPNIEYFLNHNNPSISDATIEFEFNKYELSGNWMARHNIFIPSEGEILNDISEKSILRLKLKFVQSEIKKNIKKLQFEQDLTTSEQIMQTHKYLKEIEMAISAKLGTVVSGFNAR